MNDQNSPGQTYSSEEPQGKKEQINSQGIPSAPKSDEEKKQELQDSFERVHKRSDQFSYEWDLKSEAKKLDMEVEEYQRWYELFSKPRTWFYWIFHLRVVIWIFQLIRVIWQGIGLGKIWSWCFGEKKLWDFLQLLIVPAVLAYGALYLQEDHNHQESLNKYFDNMTNLLLESKLRTSKDESEVRTIARARTLTTLRGLDDNFLTKVDGSRKGQLLRFLKEAKLVTKEEGGAIVSLSSADLSGADLEGADLHCVDLYGVDLSNANLRHAILGDNFRNAYLSARSLTGAKLSEADSFANLEGADLSNADLHGAFLNNVTLSFANLSNVDLSGANLGNEGSILGVLGAKLCNTTLPDGKVSNQDCEELKWESR
jgi:uncharacterized protein YjbI with pentapeptide repeats